MKVFQFEQRICLNKAGSRRQTNREESMKKALCIVAVLGMGLSLGFWTVGQAHAAQPAVPPDLTANPPSIPVDQKLANESREIHASKAEEFTTMASGITAIASVITMFIAGIAIFYYHEQARAATAEHLNNVHQLIFERLDSSEIREARHYVYDLDTFEIDGEVKELLPSETSGFTYQSEQWLLLSTPKFKGSEEQKEQWKKNKAKAERVARALDQLGYLVREGIVPLKVVARFYTYPTLKCWYKLCPYIGAIRNRRGQLGHMWEWENLVKKIIAGYGTDEGIWKGTRNHDNLQEYGDMIVARTSPKTFPRDENWNPPDLSN